MPRSSTSIGAIELLARLGALSRNTLGDLHGPAFFVVLGCLICQLGLGFGYAVKPLAGDIMDELGWSRSLYMLAQSPMNLVYAFSSLAVGALVGRIGAKKILIASLVWLAGVFALLSIMQSWWQYSALVVALGLALTGLGDITVAQLVTQWVKKGRGLALGIVYTGSNLGGYLFIPFVVGIAERDSWRDALLSMSGIALFAMLPAALLLVRERRRHESVDLDAEVIGDLGSERDIKPSMALRTRSFWILAFSLLAFFAYFMTMIDHLILFLTDQGMERVAASQHLRNALGLGIASKLILGLIADRISHRHAVQVVFGLLTLSSALLFSIPGDSIWFWTFVVTLGFSTAARDVVYPLIVTECFGQRWMAPIYGALMLAFLPGATLGPVFAAAIHDTMGSYQLSLLTLLIMNGLAFVGLFFVRDERGPLG